MEVVFWWNIPCAGMINVLKNYAEKIDTTALVITGELSQSRKAMGWKDNGKLFDNHIVLSDEEWDYEGKKYIDKYSDRLHVFNGITYTLRMHKLIEYAISKGVAFCNMSEAYFNLEKGWKRMIKSVFISCVLPFKTKRVVHNSQGIICLSGGSARDVSQFKRLGFTKFYPYGYFTEEISELEYLPAADGKVHILCPGLLEHYKGVDILIAALAILKKNGITGFVCHITGSGSEKTLLKDMVRKYGLDDNVIFEGVLDQINYNALLATIDMLVAPGRVEPWGIRINEAIQRGNVVIVSDGIGANYMIKESKGGEVFKSGSASDLAKKLSFYVGSVENIHTAKENNRKYKDSISCLTQATRLQGYINEICNKL